MSQPYKINILIIRGGGIGDILLTIPALHLIIKLLPNCNITFLSTWSLNGKSSPLPLLYELGLIHNHISIPFITKTRFSNYLQLFKVIYNERNKFHISICLRHSLRRFGSRLIDYLLFKVSLNTRAGIGFWNASELSNLNISKKDTFPMVQEYKRLVHILGSEGFDIDIHDFIASFNIDILDKIMKIDVNLKIPVSNKKFIVICPFARDEKKKWCLDNYVELSKVLINNGFHIYVIGGNDEKKEGEEMIKRIQKNATNLCGELTLIESVKLF